MSLAARRRDLPFWEAKRLDEMDPEEWEALCDGCGKCCMNKLEDEDTGHVEMTRIACRLFDDATCRCGQYETRQNFVPECIRLTPTSLELHAYWLPDSCAYKKLSRGQKLEPWHPLISGTQDTVHMAGISMQHRTIPEFEVSDEEWEDHIIEEPR